MLSVITMRARFERFALGDALEVFLRLHFDQSRHASLECKRLVLFLRTGRAASGDDGT